MMKIKTGKSCSAVSLFIFLFSLAIGSCENPFIQRIVEPKTASFESNGGSRVESQTVYKDQTIRRPKDPSRSGFTFAAWYSDNETFLREWDFSTIPTEDITLYARWIDASEPPPPTEIITDVAIIVTQPVTGGVPMTSVSGASYTGTVSWIPDNNPFAGGVEYTATVTLTARKYFAFAPELESATINGNEAGIVNNTESSLTLSYKFPPTRTVTGVAITTAPKESYTHGETLDLSALVVTITYSDSSTEDIAFDKFEEHGITVSMANGTALSRSGHNGVSVTVTYGSFERTITLIVGPRVTTLTVEPIAAKTFNGDPITPEVTVKDGATTLTENIDYTVEYSNNTNAGIATVGIKGINNYEGSSGGAEFTINKADIASVAVTITGPANGETPVTTATGTGNFTMGTVTWSPADDTFKGSTVYTASVTLTADQNYAFASTLTATITGIAADVFNNTGNMVTLSHTFAETEAKAVTSITIITQPTNLTYTHGDPLNLTGLAVTLTHDDGTTEPVALGDFESKNITTNPVHDAVLSHSSHDDQPVAVKHGGLTANTTKLTVNTKALTIAGASHTRQYDSTTNANGVSVTLSGIVGNDDVSVAAVTAVYTSANAGTQTINITAVSLTGTAAGNYTVTTPANNITVTGITKANPTVTWPSGFTATYGQTLSAIELPGNGTSTPAGTFTWTNGTTSVGNAGTQSHSMTFTPTDTANYNTPTPQDVNITVNKATGATVNAPTATADNIGVNIITLNIIEIPDQTVEYARNDSNTAPTSGWQTDRTFSGLNSGTTYYFFARFAENDNHNAGAASSGTAITTLQNIGINITLNTDELTDPSLGGILDKGTTISKTGTGYNQTANISITGTYQSISWVIRGVGAYANQSVSGSTPSFALEATNPIYNSPGYHVVEITFTVGVMQYQSNFRFRIVE